MNDRRIRSIVIVGGGTAGWMTAAALAKINEARTFTVTLIESDEIGTIGVGEATIPTIHWFNQLIGLDERAFLRETRATFKLGIEFVGWSASATSYFHPFGSYGAPGDGSMFYHRWLKAKLGGQETGFEAYSLSTALARAGKFSPPATDPALDPVDARLCLSLRRQPIREVPAPPRRSARHQARRGQGRAHRAARRNRLHHGAQYRPRRTGSRPICLSTAPACVAC